MTDSSDSILEQILAGDLAENAPRAQALFASDPNARARLQELRAIEGALKAERVRAQAALETPVAGEDALLRAFAAHAARQGAAEDSARPRDQRRSVWFVALAASLLAVVWIGWRARSGADDSAVPRTLGETGALSPDGRSSDYRLFEWNFDPPANGFVELSILSEDGRTLAREPEIVGRSLKLEPERAASLPNRIRWRIVEHGADGAPTGRAFEASAWR